MKMERIRVEGVEREKARRVLKGHTGMRYTVLTDVRVVDMVEGASGRFEVTYVRLSLEYARRMMVKVVVEAEEGVESIVHRYKGASWMEREAWDMYGVAVVGHEDLRRLLLDYG